MAADVRQLPCFVRSGECQLAWMTRIFAISAEFSQGLPRLVFGRAMAAAPGLLRNALSDARRRAMPR